jgi:tetratricopeptide (TPR) repeat protein
LDLAYNLRWEGDYGRARLLTEESLSLSRELKDPRGISGALVVLGELARDDGHYDRAMTLFQEALTFARESGDSWLIASRLIYMGSLAVRQGQYGSAAALLEEALAMKRAVADEADIPHMLNLLGWAARGLCDLERARRLCSEGLRGSQALGAVWGSAESFEQLARLDAGAGRPERAARLFAAADALQESMRLRRSPSDQPDHDDAVAAVRSSLGGATFTTAWTEGRAMTLEQAVAYALEEPPSQ